MIEGMINSVTNMERCLVVYCLFARVCGSFLWWKWLYFFFAEFYIVSVDNNKDYLYFGEGGHRHLTDVL